MIERIAVLGGSSVYIPEFVFSAVSQNICVKEIMLIGRSEKKLAIVAQFCQRLVNRSGFPLNIAYTTNMEEGIRGAEFVLNNIRVGGMSGRLRDEKLPPRYGLLGDESLGAGGISSALRTLPVLFDIARLVEKTAPNTFFLNLTNPMGVCVEALTKYTPLNVIGICDLPALLVKRVAEFLHLNQTDMVVDYVGLNHFGWIQDLRINGRSCMARLVERITRNGDDTFDKRLVELFRLVPVRTVNLFFYRDSLLKKQQAMARFRAEELQEAEDQILKLYEDPHLTEIPPLTRARNAIWYSETIVPIIKAMTNKSDHRFILCVKNNGSIRDLPDDSSVEIPVVVNKKRFTGQPVGSCPRFLKGIFFAMKESDRLIIEAVRHKSYEYALQALVVNPLVGSLDSARSYLDQVIKEDALELH